MFLHGLKTKLFKHSADPGTGVGGGEPAGVEPDKVTAAPVPAQEPIDVEAVKSQAVSDLLANLGVASIDEAKASLDSWKEYQDGQKSDLEKLQDNLATANQSLADRDETIAGLQAQLAAAQLGVPGENVADVITLAKGLVTDQVDINAAIATVLEKYPHFKGGGDLASDKPSFVVATQSQTTTTEDAFKKALGLN